MSSSVPAAAMMKIRHLNRLVESHDTYMKSKKAQELVGDQEAQDVVSDFLGTVRALLIPRSPLLKLHLEPTLPGPATPSPCSPLAPSLTSLNPNACPYPRLKRVTHLLPVGHCYLRGLAVLHLLQEYPSAHILQPKLERSLRLGTSPPGRHLVRCYVNPPPSLSAYVDIQLTSRLHRLSVSPAAVNYLRKRGGKTEIRYTASKSQTLVSPVIFVLSCS
jgi:hypothetical protein